MIDYRDDSLAIPNKVPDRTALPSQWARPNPEHPYRASDFVHCVDFRMPVVDDVPLHGVRRPKISNERNRGVSYAKGSARSVRKLSSAPNSKCAHNFGVVARGLLTGDLMFCTVCEFNDLRVAKLTRLATSGRLLRWPVFSGMACINFSRAKMSAANQANLFRSVWSRYFSRRRCRLAQS